MVPGFLSRSVGFQDYSLFSTASSLSGLSIPRAGNHVHHTRKYLESFCRGFYLKTDGPHFSNILYLTRDATWGKARFWYLEHSYRSICWGAWCRENTILKCPQSFCCLCWARWPTAEEREERGRKQHKCSSSYLFPGHPLPWHYTPDTLNRKFPHQACHFETPPLVHGQNICVPPLSPTSIHCLS